MSKPVQIFLCHASEDKPKVVKVYRFLQQQGFKPWLDKEDLLPGQHWDQEIPKALKASDFVLIFFSQKSTTKRGYVQREFKLALEVLDEIPDGQIFVIPVRLDECEIPERFHFLHYCDLFDAGGPDKVMRAIRAGLQGVGRAQPVAATPPQLLRSKPLRNLSFDAVKTMLQQKGFFDKFKNEQGRSFQHQYKNVERNGAKLVIDQATGLTWQRGRSEELMNFNVAAQKYIAQLNQDRFADYNDWRLPTLEEAMSLMELRKSSEGLYIDPVFDKNQLWICTADQESEGVAWYVYFFNGICLSLYVYYYNYVRAVRSGQS